MEISGNINFTNFTTAIYDDVVGQKAPSLPNDVTDPNYDAISQLAIPTIYFIIATVGLTGNGIVLYIMRNMVKSKSVTDVYVTNLAIADILLLSNLPFWATDLILGEWIFGKSMCKIASCMTYLNMYASIYFLAAMSLDRWLAIVKAIKCRSLRTVRNAWIMCLIIWCFGLIFIILPALFRTTKTIHGKERCIWSFPIESQVSLNLTYNISRTVLGFMVPLIVIMFCYTDLNIFMRKRTKAKKNKNDCKKKDKLTVMILVVISCFVISWLPNQITNFVHLLKLLGVLNYQCATEEKVEIQFDFSLFNLTDNLTAWNVNDFLGGNTTDLFESIAEIAASNFPSFGENSTLRLLTKPKECSNYWVVMHIHLITACLGFFNSMMNPVVYSFMGITFRKKLRILFSCDPGKHAFPRRNRQSFWTSVRYTTTTRIRSSVISFSRRNRKSANSCALNRPQNNNPGSACQGKDSFLTNHNKEDELNNKEQQQHQQNEAQQQEQQLEQQPEHTEQQNLNERDEDQGLFPDYYEADLENVHLCDVTPPHATQRSIRKTRVLGSLRGSSKRHQTITGVSTVLEEPTVQLEDTLMESHRTASSEVLYGGVWMGNAV